MFLPHFSKSVSHAKFLLKAFDNMLLLAMAHLCIAVSNYFPSGSASITFDVFGWTFGMALGEGTGFVDVGSLCACLVFLCLSFVFKYGQMLQSVSDDTV